jgi:hypothetical protein
MHEGATCIKLFLLHFHIVPVSFHSTSDNLCFRLWKHYSCVYLWLWRLCQLPQQ